MTSEIPWKRLAAEVVAIVFGILLAFSVDAWYDQVVQRNQESAYRERLEVDLREVRDVLGRIDNMAKHALDFRQISSGLFI